MKILAKSIYFLLIACMLYFLINYLSVPLKASKNFKTKHYISKTDGNNHIIVQDLAQNLIFTNMQKGCKPINKKDGTLGAINNFLSLKKCLWLFL